MSINRPRWPHSAVQVIQQINAELMQRLNSDPRPQGLWALEVGQLNLSKQGGGLRIVWSILGGRIHRGWPFDGDPPAPCRAVRLCKIRSDIFCNKPETVGITPDDYQQAEEILRAVILVWNNQRPADYDDDEQQEGWPAKDNHDVGQRNIHLTYEVNVLLPVLDDPYLFKTITSVESTPVIGERP